MVVLSVGTAVFCGLVDDAGHSSSASAPGVPIPGPDPSKAIRVTAIGPSGTPVSGVRILATPADADGGWDSMECLTEPSGACTLNPFPPSAAAPTYLIDAEAEWQARRVPTVRPGESVSLELVRR